MWIRSQDEEILIFTRKFFINEIFKDFQFRKRGIKNGRKQNERIGVVCGWKC